MNSATYSVAAKLMIAGEYSVLFGGKALATTLSPTMQVTCEVGDLSEALSICSNLYHQPKTYSTSQLRHSHGLDPASHVFALLSQKASSHGLTIPPGVKITVDSAIPLTAGMGSSSALRLGVVLSAQEALGLDFPPDTLLKIAHDSQRDWQKSPASGYDILTQFHGGMVVSRSLPGSAMATLESHITEPKALADTHQKLSIYSQNRTTTPTGPQIQWWLDRLHQQADAPQKLQRYQRAHDQLIDGFLARAHTTELAMAFGEVRKTSPVPELCELFTQLESTRDFDQNFSVKTTGAGGHDSLLAVGDVPEQASAVLARFGFSLLPVRLSSGGAQRQTP